MRRGLVAVAIAAGLLGPAEAARASAGDLDATFATGGRLLLDAPAQVPAIGEVLGIGLRLKGGFILAGNTGAGAGRKAVLIAMSGRGNLDPRWGAGGVVSQPTTVRVLDVAVTPDGGAATGFAGCPTRARCDRYGYLRFDHDGNLAAHPTVAPRGYSARGGEIVPDGSGGLVVAGEYRSRRDRSLVALSRFDAADQPVPGFGFNGSAFSHAHAAIAVEGVLHLRDGSYLVVGEKRRSDRPNAPVTGFGLVRFSAAGALLGQSTVRVGPVTLAGAVQQPSGGVVLLGARPHAGVLARVRPTGGVDRRFGRGGIAGLEGTRPSALAVQPDGRLLVAGRAGSAWILTRLLPGSRPDTGFGGGGTVRVVPLARATAGPPALTVSLQGKPVLAGVVTQAAPRRVVVATMRFLP